MTDKQTPPDWVLREAAKRSRSAGTPLENLVLVYEDNFMFRALCDLIAETQQPPVDRKVLCAREADRLWREDGMPTFGKNDVNPIAVRAIELYEQGYGSDKIDH